MMELLMEEDVPLVLNSLSVVLLSGDTLLC